MPLILRIDGKAFHTYTRGCKKPFDKALADLMDETAKYLCENIQDAQLAYVQSDEISIFVHDYKSLVSEAWFQKELQKMDSIASGMASAFFTMNSWKLFIDDNPVDTYPGNWKDLMNLNRIAVFDTRCFVLPENELCNYFIWRQQDATRNSIQMQARSLYSHSECENKNQSDLQEMIHQKGQNWNDTPTGFKRGRCVRRKTDEEMLLSMAMTGNEAIRNPWIIDQEIPIFTADRNFIERHLEVNKEVKE
jgi:tRNA(His) 5'-end guanylyltransferase